MALISCDECGNEVSSKAETCPNCGAPVAGGPGSAQTVEDTSKKFKAHQLLGAASATIGTVGTCSMAGDGSNQISTLGIVFVVMALLGMVWFIGSRIGAWWHHG